MGKKIKKKPQFIRSQSNFNIPSVRKANKLKNQMNKNINQKHKNNSNSKKIKNLISKIKNKLSKPYHSNSNKINKTKNFNNKNNNNTNNNNPFIFNTIYNNFNNQEKKKDKAEWMKPETKKIEDISNRFHKEIIDYVNYIIPNNTSLIRRQNTMQRLEKIIQKYQPNWKVVLFGSFSQNTSTVFSDLDFVILNEVNYSSKNLDIKELDYLMRILRREGFSRNIRLIKARVPILKATCSITGINVDISVNRQNGFQAASLIRKILEKYKVLKPTIIILKILLKKNNLNEAHTGGMSSFLLFHLVYFFFIHHFKKKNENYTNENLSKKSESKSNSEISESDDEEDIASYDSNSDLKLFGKNKYSNSDGIVTTKAVSSTSEECNSNDDSNSNLLKNGDSSSNSEEEKKIDIDSDEDDDSGNDDNILINNFKDDNNEINIGSFLVLLLKFYGFDFDYDNYGFSLYKNNFGSIFIKVERTDMDCSDTICVESIQDQGIDIGKSCYNYEKIVYLFKATYNKINIEKKNNTCSILKALGFPTI